MKKAPKVKSTVDRLGMKNINIPINENARYIN
jgi:hypothetical protein